MKHIKRDYSLNARGSDLGGEAKAKIKIFRIWSSCISN